jgi:replicative DNA helicase
MQNQYTKKPQSFQAITPGFEIGKIPPQSIDFEMAILGACLLESNAISQVANILKPESFYRDEHQNIYKSIINLFDSGKKVDLMTCMEQLRKDKNLESIGGAAYISELTNNIGSGAHVEFHARIIQQKFIQRELIRISSEIQNQAFDESIEVSDLLDYSSTELNKIIIQGVKKTGRFIKEIVKDVILSFEEIIKSGKKISGIPSGFNSIDKITLGWQKTDLIIIAARPSMGKTFIALMLASYPTKIGFKVVFFSIEMSEQQLVIRLIALETKIENGFFKTCEFNDDVWSKINTAQESFNSMDLIIDDTAGLTITEFRAKVLLYKRMYGIDMIIIDYLQLMNSSNGGNREGQVSYISRSLKEIAKEIEVPIICLSQVNRTCETRPDKRPHLSDLRESGAIEQDADIVAFLFRPEYYGITEDENNESTRGMLEIYFEKHRNGKLGSAFLKIEPNFTGATEKDDEILKQLDLNPNEFIEPNIKF